MQHHGAVERVRQVAATGSAHLDDLDLITAFDGFGQPLADLAAASNHDAFVAFIQAAHFAHHGANIGAGGDEKDFVVGLDHCVATGRNWPITSENRRHPCIHIRHVLAQLAQLLTNQRAAVVRLDRHQLRLAFREVDHLQGTGVFDQALDVIGHHLLGADQHIDRNRVVVEQLFAPAQVGRFTHAGNFGGCVEQRVRHLAGDHVGLVAVGHCHQHVGIVGARLTQYIGQ